MTRKYKNPHIGEIIEIKGKQYRIEEYNPYGEGVCDGCAFAHTYCDNFDVPGNCYKTILKEVHSGNIHDETSVWETMEGGEE